MPLFDRSHMQEVHPTVDLVQDKVSLWIREIVHMLPDIALAILILIIFTFLARFLKGISNKLLLRVVQSGTLQRLAVSLIYVTTILIGLFAALSVLQLDKTVTSLLAGAGILGLALGFAFQDIASNFIAGIIIATNRPYRVGELIETKDHIGVVQRIDLRTSELRSLQGIQVIIPNKELFQNVLINHTRNGVRRVDVVVRVSYRTDLRQVKQVAHDAVRKVNGVLQEKDVDLFFQSFKDDAIELEVRFWIQALGNRYYNLVRSDAIMSIKDAFDLAGIKIPLPIRTLELRKSDGWEQLKN